MRITLIDVVPGVIIGPHQRGRGIVWTRVIVLADAVLVAVIVVLALVPTMILVAMVIPTTLARLVQRKRRSVDGLNTGAIKLFHSQLTHQNSVGLKKLQRVDAPSSLRCLRPNAGKRRVRIGRGIHV